jgi:multidrug efflux system membrane fusion protein
MRARPIHTVALALLLSGCAQKGAPRQETVPVHVAPVEVRDIPLEIDASGTIEALRTVSVRPQVTGVLTRVAFREGAEIGERQALFQIDPRPFRAALDQALANLDRHRVELAKAERDADRYRELMTGEFVSRTEYEATVAAADALRSTVRADSASVEAARLNLEYTTIRAPIAGRTGAIAVDEGNLVRTADSAPLVVIHQVRPILVRFAVPEGEAWRVPRTDLHRVRVLARRAEVDTAWVEGHLTFVDNGIDPATGTLLLKAEFENAARTFLPGQFVQARMVLSVQKGARVVPTDAVTEGQQGRFVYVVEKDSTVALRPVTQERAAGDWAVIADGLTPGETVVVDGQSRLRPGSKVRVR